MPVVNTPAVATDGGSAAIGAPFASIAELAAAVQPAVVQLNVTGGGGQGTGSGFIISPDGYIITNHHVAGPAAQDGRIEVSFLDGRTATGKVVGTNPGYDLAVVKVDRTGLPTLPLGRSGDLKVGDSVIAIGSPLGLQGTVTTGIVSALNRPVTAGDAQAGEETAFINAIQTDAAINPGNSGGPLVDSTGAVIGVNSAIASMATGGQAGSIGLGFAIPIDTAKRIADELITTGSSSTPVVGVKLQMDFEGPGAKVVDITGKPATESELRIDDIITKVDGQRIADPTALIVTIRSYAPGDRVTLTVERDGREFTVPVTLEASKS
jgi:putative serine protease PepD